MRRWLMSALFVSALLSIGITLLAQGDSFEPSPYIYKIKAADCASGPEQRVQSGFRINNQVGIFTALHGVLNCKTVIAEPGGEGQTFDELMIGKVDIDRDVAVLWSKELASEPLAGLAVITQTMQIDQKAAYQVIGYPLNVFRQKPTIDVKILERTELGNLLTDEAILALEERKSPAMAANVLSIQSHLVPGHSGAPILNQMNQVVAIGNGGLDAGRVEMGWAIPWDELEFSTVVVGVSQQVSWRERGRLRELADSDSSSIFAYNTSEASINIPTPQLTTTVDLRVLDNGLTENTYLIEGESHVQFNIGADLVVYAEPIPDTEVVIALLKVIGKSPNSLTAQAILIDPETEIRARMRVDNQLAFISQSRLVPVFDYADGYLLRPGLIRLHSDQELAVGTQLQALEFERISGEIVDALRTDTIMRITSIGVDKQLAAVELITGTWPVTGAIVSMVEVQPIPATMTPPTPTTVPERVSVIQTNLVERVVRSRKNPEVTAKWTTIEVDPQNGISKIQIQFANESSQKVTVDVTQDGTYLGLENGTRLEPEFIYPKPNAFGRLITSIEPDTTFSVMLEFSIVPDFAQRLHIFIRSPLGGSEQFPVIVFEGSSSTLSPSSISDAPSSAISEVAGRTVHAMENPNVTVTWTSIEAGDQTDVLRFNLRFDNKSTKQTTIDVTQNGTYLGLENGTRIDSQLVGPNANTFGRLIVDVEPGTAFAAWVEFPKIVDLSQRCHLHIHSPLGGSAKFPDLIFDGVTPD